MGRKEKPVDADGPVALFALALREQRRRAGSPTYKKMAALVHYSAPALSLAAGAGRLPTWPCTEAYLRGCGVVDPEDVRGWRLRWDSVRAEIAAQKATAPQATSESVTQNLQLAWQVERLSDDFVLADIRVTTIDELRYLLNQVRRARNLSIRDISQQSLRPAADGGVPRVLPPSTIHQVLTGEGRISRAFVIRYLAACGYHPDDVRGLASEAARLAVEHSRAHEALRVLKSMPAPDDDEVDPPIRFAPGTDVACSNDDRTVRPRSHRAPNLLTKVLARLRPGTKPARSTTSGASSELAQAVPVGIGRVPEFTQGTVSGD